MITYDHAHLLSAISFVSQASASKGTLECMRLIHFTADRVTATDLDTTASVRIAGEGDIKPFCVNAIDLLNGLSACSKAVSISIEKNTDNQDAWVAVVSGTTSFKLALFNTAEFPALPDEKPVNEFSVEASLFKAGLDSAHFQKTNFPSRFTLDGVNISSNGTFQFQATDGYGVVIATLKSYTCEQIFDVVLPAKLVTLLRRVENGTATVQITRNHILYECGDIMIAARQLSGKFPNVKGMRAEPNRTFSCRTEVLARALNQGQPFAGETKDIKTGSRFTRLQLTKVNNGIEVFAKSETSEFSAVTEVDDLMDFEPFKINGVIVRPFLSAMPNDARLDITVKEKACIGIHLSLRDVDIEYVQTMLNF
jgi:DNA polymerase III sliding clamp (beta) subunit (PCNA family)